MSTAAIGSWLPAIRIRQSVTAKASTRAVRVHTNNIESFWSLLKRGVIGTYHHVSKKYLPLYFAEFRHNNRREADIFGKAIAGA
jgi:ISXO2-like transposase domain